MATASELSLYKVAAMEREQALLSLRSQVQDADQPYLGHILQ